MCVISICRTVRLTDEQVIQQYDANPHGGGAAWRAVEEGLPVVQWSKGNDRDQMVELNKTLPFPYVLHFRVPSNNTTKSLFGCHPFVIDDDATYYYEGTTPNHVLFHNGHWHTWKEKLQAISINGLIRIPSGPWSDSRALALAANYLGRGFLTLVEEKVVTLGPGDTDLEAFGPWETIENPDGEGKPQKILVSNKGWIKETPRVVVPLQINSRSVDRSGGADANATTFRNGGGGVGSIANIRRDRETQIPTGDAQVVNGPPEGNSFSVASPFLKQCQGCPKQTNKGTTFNDRWYCWHCWSDRTQNRITTPEPLVGKCHICTHSYGASKLQSNNEWVCRTCWEVNGKPVAYYVSGRTSGNFRGDD